MDGKSGTATIVFQAGERRVIDCFRQDDNRYFLQRCLHEILKRRFKVAVTGAEPMSVALGLGSTTAP